MSVKEIFKLFIERLFENLTSVKVWFFIIPFIGSSFMLWYICSSQFGFITTALATVSSNPELAVNILSQIKVITDTFLAWCTFNATLIGSIIVVREIFKVRKLREINDSNNDIKVEKINKIKI